MAVLHRSWAWCAAVLAAWLGAAAAAPPPVPSPVKPSSGLPSRLPEHSPPRIVSVSPKRPAPGAALRIVLDRPLPKGLAPVIRPRGRRPVPLKGASARGKVLELRLPRPLPPGPAGLYLADPRRPGRALSNAVTLRIASGKGAVPAGPKAAGPASRPGPAPVRPAGPGAGPAGPGGKSAAGRHLRKETPAGRRAMGLPAGKAPVPSPARRGTAGTVRTRPLRYAGRAEAAWTPPRPARGAIRTAALRYLGGREAARPAGRRRVAGTTGTIRTAALRYRGEASAVAWRPPHPSAGAVQTAVLRFVGGRDAAIAPRARGRRGGVTSGAVRTAALIYRGGSEAENWTPPAPRAGAVRTAVLRYRGGSGEAAPRTGAAGRGVTAGTVRTPALRYTGGAGGAGWTPPPVAPGAVRVATLRYVGQALSGRRTADSDRTER